MYLLLRAQCQRHAPASLDLLRTTYRKPDRPTIKLNIDGLKEALAPISIQEGTGVLVDGFHRVEAATRLGVEAIPVRMLDIPDEELHLYAGLGNCGHGRALNRAE